MVRIMFTVAVLGGCALDPAGLGAGATDAFVGDAGPRGDSGTVTRDGGLPADGCIPQAEACNDADDDCDRLVDENFDLSADRAHCGRCDNTCPSDAACVAGRCADELASTCGGGSHTCVTRVDGHVFCWGDNSSSQLGDGLTTSRSAPARVAGLDDAFQVICGAAHTCARTRIGAVFCWGLNGLGQLGVGDTSIRSTPAQVLGVNALKVTTRVSHTCALEPAGTLTCWGHNDAGQLGATPRRVEPLPIAVPTVLDVVDVAVGRDTTCVVLGSGQVHCWGNNDYGQLGRGTVAVPPFDPTPRPVRGLADAVAVTSGYQHTCALRASGILRCWGRNFNGQLGSGSSERARATPVDTLGLTSIESASAGHFFTCALTTAGMTWCWGQNTRGQIGQPVTVPLRNSPEGIAIGGQAMAIGAGSQHACASTGRRAFCWGSNGLGQLGASTPATAEPTPVEVGLP